MIHRLAIKCEKKIFLLEQREIECVEAARNYVRIFTSSTSLMTRTSMAQVESHLHKERFTRVHRSVIVNVSQIGCLEARGTGNYLLTLKSGRQVTASRKYIKQLLSSIRAQAPLENWIDIDSDAEIDAKGEPLALAREVV